jgi:MFS family permease
VTGAYRWWLAGATLSQLGTHTLAFAMAWSAGGHSGTLAGLVLTMIVAPRVTLALLGGATADRVGAWRVMALGDAVMGGVTLALAGAVAVAGERPAVLLCAALAIGVVDAFYLPSSGSMPRRLVPAADLARALSARQIAGQLTAFAAAPLGGLVVATAGLPAAALLDAATFAGMLVVLFLLRPRMPVGEPSSAPVTAVWREVGDGIALTLRDPLLRPALLLAAAAAGLLLPVGGLLVPLLGHDRLWPAAVSGLVVGAIAVGTATATVLVLFRGSGPRPGAVAVAGLLLAAGGLLGLASSAVVPAAVAAGALIGLGTGLFTTHLGPLLLGSAPVSHLARVQAVVLLAQSLPLIATNNMLGGLADVLAPGLLVGGCGIGLATAALAALRSTALRQAGGPATG